MNDPSHATHAITNLSVTGLLTQLMCLAALFMALVITPAASRANSAESASAAATDTVALDAVRETLLRAPNVDRASAVIADVTSFGHWRLMNLKGDTFTAANEDELARGLANLVPIAVELPTRTPVFYLTRGTVFDHPNWLRMLPARAPKMIVFEQSILALTIRKPTQSAQKQKDATPRIAVRLKGGTSALLQSPDDLRELLWQARRTVETASLRILSLAPDHPGPLASTRDADQRGLVAEKADPYKLAQSLKYVSGQTIVIAGLQKGDFLHFRPPGEDEKTVLISVLEKAARRADVNLLIVNTASSAQPGARNMLFLQTEINGLSDLKKRISMAELLGRVVSTTSARTLSLASPIGLGSGSHVSLTVGEPSQSKPRSTGTLSTIKRWWTSATSSVSGTLPAMNVRATLRRSAHDLEMQRRLVSWLPSWVPFVWLGLLVTGLLTVAQVWRWWSRFWPEPSDAALVSADPSYYLARASQGAKRTLFFLIGLPALAVPGLIATLLARLKPRGKGRNLEDIGSQSARV